LDYYYGKDAGGAWLLADPSGLGGLVPTKIAGVDTATFAMISDPKAFCGTSEPFSCMYTKDKNHVYAYGQAIDEADPIEFAIDDPPKVTTCQYDANESYQKYYLGSAIPQVGAEQLP
jgi:hypothetical protein